MVGTWANEFRCVPYTYRIAPNSFFCYAEDFLGAQLGWSCASGSFIIPLGISLIKDTSSEK